ncbi:MAG: single-stranded DNA-binding protein [Flexibacter sp. CG_4_10_14_3_um_filter_32_15]|nr:MAG: single-stranded DNA-binding protein [Flexibacter sp. CG_4_10_14_3_um_filter_32_15]
MAGVNKVILLGRLGKDPDVRTLESGSKLATVSLATGKSYKDQSGEWQEKTEWHRLTFWRDNADRAERLRKGDQVYVEGELTTRSWEQDNITRYVTEIVVNYSQIIERNSNNNGGGVPPITEEPVTQTKQTKSPAPELSGSGNPEDDLPF